MAVAAEEEAWAGGDGGGDDAFVEFSGAEQFEFLSDFGGEEGAVLAGGEEGVLGDGGGGVEGGGGSREGFAPEGLAGLGIEADDLAAMAQEVDTAVVFGGGGDEDAEVVALPGAVGGGDVAGAAQFDAEEAGLVGAVVAADGDDGDLVMDEGGGDGGPEAGGVGVEAAGGPEEGTVGGVMGGGVVGAPDEEGGAALVLEEERGGVAVVVFGGGLELAGLAPLEFAGGLVEAGDPRLALVHAGEDDVAVGDDGGAALIPEEAFGAEAVDEVVLPADFAVEFEGGEGAAAEVDEDGLAVGDRGGVTARAKGAMARGAFLAEFGLPELLALEIEGQDGVFAVGRAGEVDAVVPDDGGRGAFAGQGGFPGDGISGPGVEWGRVGGAAGAGGPAPGGPIGGGGREGVSGEEGGGSEGGADEERGSSPGVRRVHGVDYLVLNADRFEDGRGFSQADSWGASMLNSEPVTPFSYVTSFS